MDQLAVHHLPSVATGGAMPPAAPLAMPTQDLQHAPQPRFAWRIGGVRALLARLLVAAGTAAIVSHGVSEMIAIVINKHMSLLQVMLTAFFAASLTWIALSAMTTLAGLLPAGQRRLAPPLDAGSALAHRTALVMPIYNEDALRTTMAMRAMAEDLKSRGLERGFEIVLLSDSTQADAWIRESIAAAQLREALTGTMPVWYRHRWRNSGRKAGNLQDFVEHWGARYDYMIVLDADSLMQADTLATLVRSMQADEQLALLQTVPLLIGRSSLFARLQQFASRIYGPSIARGVAAWSGDDGNYWGHNAILRVAAFAGCCGLPELPGRQPFGGHILSHDFVEAALLRRAGWKVCMADGLGGSYEETPPTLADLAVRDRRWAQGNLQHVGVIGAAGLRGTSRLHFAFGIMSYLASPLWLVLVVLGLALSVQASLHGPQYFGLEFQLFPNWPRFDSPRMLKLFWFCLGVLFLPKALGFLRALLSLRMHRMLGSIEFIASAAVEVLLSALYAPVQMLLQSRHVVEILLGRDSGWLSQRREESRGSWHAAWQRHWGHTLAGVLLGVLFAALAPQLLPWLAPVLAGMLLAVPLSHWSGSQRIGRALARIGILSTPEEVEPPAIAARRDALLAAAAPLPEDGLRELAQDGALRAIHLNQNAPPPLPARGRPDTERLTAAQKLRDAYTLDEALSWLTARERVQVAADAAMLDRLAVLANCGA